MDLEGVSEIELLEGSLRQTMEFAKEMKLSLAQENKGRYDIAPFVVVGVEMTDEEGNKGIGGAVVEMELSNSGNPADHLPQMLSDIHEQGLRKFRWIMLIVEGYAKRLDTGEGNADAKKYQDLSEYADYQRGQLEKEFHENPLSGVEEGLIGCAFSWSGESAGATQFYKCGDDGSPIYDEEMVITSHEKHDEGQGGRIPEIFSSFIKYCQMVELLTK